MATTILVRIRALKEKGVEQYTYKGNRFKAGMGWYELPAGAEGEQLAAELKELKHNCYDEDSPLLFDVLTKEDAQKLETKERAQAMSKAAAGEAIRTVPKVDSAVVIEPTAPVKKTGKGKSKDDDAASFE